MKQFVLYDQQANAYAGLKGAKVVAEESRDKAVVFDERDNPTIKAKFYSAITGMNFVAVVK